MVTNIFVNIMTKDLEKAKTFYKALGWEINPNFTDETAASVVIGKNIYAMILTEAKIKEFTTKELIDSWNATEVITALSVESKEEVDELVEKAITAGGKKTRELEDYGFMYSRSFEDLDGHQWEVFWMDPTAAEDGPPQEVANNESK